LAGLLHAVKAAKWQRLHEQGGKSSKEIFYTATLSKEKLHKSIVYIKVYSVALFRVSYANCRTVVVQFHPSFEKDGATLSRQHKPTHRKETIYYSI